LTVYMAFAYTNQNFIFECNSFIKPPESRGRRAKPF
jgi:hypothetical protein